MQLITRFYKLMHLEKHHIVRPMRSKTYVLVTPSKVGMKIRSNVSPGIQDRLCTSPLTKFTN